MLVSINDFLFELELGMHKPLIDGCYLISIFKCFCLILQQKGYAGGF